MDRPEHGTPAGGTAHETVKAESNLPVRVEVDSRREGAYEWPAR